MLPHSVALGAPHQPPERTGDEASQQIAPVPVNVDAVAGRAIVPSDGPHHAPVEALVVPSPRRASQPTQIHPLDVESQQSVKHNNTFVDAAHAGVFLGIGVTVAGMGTLVIGSGLPLGCDPFTNVVAVGKVMFGGGLLTSILSYSAASRSHQGDDDF